MAFFKLTEVQAEAVLNMRLRNLRKLEEMEIRTEYDKLAAERDVLQGLLGSETKQWKEIRKQIAALKKMFGPDTELGRRRTEIGTAPAPIDIDELEEALIEKEPVTMICSAKGWIRAFRGHGHKPDDIKYKDGDSEKFLIECQTTDKLLVLGTNGRFYTIGADKLPSGRGFGEPLRLMIDLPNDAEITVFKIYDASAKMIVASEDGRGFIVAEKDVLAQTKSGKQVLNVGDKTKARICMTIADSDDHIAVTGTNRRMLVFTREEMPEMGRGKGVILMRFKDGKLGDVKPFSLETGLAFKYGAGESIVEDITPWLGKRAQAGRVPPNGFPKNNKF
jgi:topoisomerase-4 subunit A